MKSKLMPRIMNPDDLFDLNQHVEQLNDICADDDAYNESGVVMVHPDTPPAMIAGLTSEKSVLVVGTGTGRSTIRDAIMNGDFLTQFDDAFEEVLKRDANVLGAVPIMSELNGLVYRHDDGVLAELIERISDNKPLFTIDHPYREPVRHDRQAVKPPVKSNKAKAKPGKKKMAKQSRKINRRK